MKHRALLSLSVLVMCAVAVPPTLSAQTPPATLYKIAHIYQPRPAAPTRHPLDVEVPDPGRAGATLAIEDNNTTGQFMGQRFELKSMPASSPEDVLKTFDALLKAEYRYIVLNVASASLVQLAAHNQNRALLFDAATRDDALRQTECLANVLHILPSRAARADALAQYLLTKRWQKWWLVIGPEAGDDAFAAALRRAAQRFGGKIVGEKRFEHGHDPHRAAQAEMPVLTQGDDYDVVVVADEKNWFGDHLSYRTWLPRPVVGTQGLVATAWHPVHEQWGAAQLQNRFKAHAGRWMDEEDYGAYLAVRSLGEAAIRSASQDMTTIKRYLLGESFALQAYKGVPLSFRPWNGELRQPILLAAARSLVAVAPLEGFMHPKNELDTLGFDQPEVTCQK